MASLSHVFSFLSFSSLVSILKDSKIRMRIDSSVTCTTCAIRSFGFHIRGE